MAEKYTENAPIISVIVPFYNRVELLFEAIESIRSQTYTDFEVLLIDDGSDEGELVLLREHLRSKSDDRFKILFKPIEYRKGANTSRAYGFRMAKGKLVKWFDSDDIMLPHFLEVQYDAMIRYELDGVISKGGLYNEDFSILLKPYWRKKFYSKNPLKDYLKTQLAWPTPAGLWQKKAIAQLDPFAQDLQNGQEWVFYLFILTSDLRIGLLEEDLFKIRIHGNSIRANKSQEYLINRMKARSMALGRLIETRNEGKMYLVKSLLMMFRKIKRRNYLWALKEIFKTLKITSFVGTEPVQLILIDVKSKKDDLSYHTNL